MFGIKLVWDGWFEDELAKERMGFPAKYDQKFDIPFGAKMLVYITGHQAIVAENKVIGTWAQGRTRYSPRGRFPLCLPIEETFRARTGLSIKEIQEVIPRFRTFEGLSFFSLSEGKYMELRQTLVRKG